MCGGYATGLVSSDLNVVQIPTRESCNSELRLLNSLAFAAVL